MEAHNETSEGSGGDNRAVGSYEQLRQQALSGDVDGWRLGLGVLQHRGVAAWLHVRKAATAATVAAAPTPTAISAPTATGIDAELVELLASMALAIAARG